MTIRETGLDIANVNYADLTQEWRSLVPLDATLLVITPFGDSFYRDANDQVWNLDLALGQVNYIAKSSAEFRELFADDQHRNQWLMPNLLTQLEHAGQELQPGQCFGFRDPPFLGGEFSVENIVPIGLQAYYDLIAQLCEASLD